MDLNTGEVLSRALEAIRAMSKEEVEAMLGKKPVLLGSDGQPLKSEFGRVLRDAVERLETALDEHSWIEVESVTEDLKELLRKASESRKSKQDLRPFLTGEESDG